MMYVRQREQIKNSRAMLERVPKDRLQYIANSFKAWDIIKSTGVFLESITKDDEFVVAQYSMDDLKVIHGHLSESARCILEMLEHFLEKAVEEADRNPFAE